MSFQRRHFALIAETIATFGTHMGPLGAADMTAETKASIALFFAGKLRATNPNFNRERFLKACRV
jgi:hypothetical protein